MTQKVTTPAKAKKFQVFVGTELKAESNDRLEALGLINDLRNENVPEIKFVNHTDKVSHLYKKDRYDKNYRVVGTEYVAPSKAVTEESATE